MADKDKIKDYLINLIEIDNPVLLEKPYEELVKLIVKANSFNIPIPYINEHPHALENLDYLAGLQLIGSANRISLFGSSMLEGKDPIGLESLESIVKSKEDYRKLAKAILKNKINTHKRGVYFSDLGNNLSEKFTDADEIIGFLDICNSWIQEEDKEEAGYFIRNIKKNQNVRRKGRKKENITDLAVTVVELSKQLRDKDIRREGFFCDFIGNINYAFHSLDEFAQGSRRIMEIMDKHDLPVTKHEKSKGIRFGLNYYTIFNTLGEFKKLIKDSDSAEYTLKQLIRFGKRIEKRYRKDGIIFSYGRLSESFNENFQIIKTVAPVFTSNRKLSKLLSILVNIEESSNIYGEEKQHLSLAYSTFGFNQEMKSLLGTQAKALKYTQLVKKSMDMEIYSHQLLGDAILGYAHLAKNSKQLERLGNVFFGIYHDYGTDPKNLLIFKPLLNSVDDLEDNKDKLPKVIEYCRAKGFNSWGWGSEDIGKTTKPIIRVSSGISDFHRKLRKVRRIAHITAKQYDPVNFISEILPEFSESVSSFDSLKSSIYAVQEYIRQWNQSGIDPLSVLDDGFKTISHMLKEKPLDEILFTLDTCARAAKKEDVLEDSFSFVKSIGGRNGIKGFVKNCEEYISLFNDAIDIAKSARKTNLDIDTVKIGQDYGDLNKGYFFRYMDECKHFIYNGLIPCETIVNIYLKTNHGRKEEFIKDIRMKIEDIRSKKKFNPNDILERYAVYNFAKGYKDISLIKFKEFDEICKAYVKGEYISDSHSAEVNLLNKYSSVKNKKYQTY